MTKAPLNKCLWPKHTIKLFIRNFWKDTSGVSATEFALVAPIFLILLSGIVDIGFTLYSKFRMEGQVSFIANYAMTSEIPASNSEAEDFLETLTDMARLSESNNSIQRLHRIHVNLNNAYVGTWENGIFSAQSLSGDVSDCYCPVRAGNTIIWGISADCGLICTDNSAAGKYLWFEAENSSPISLFSQFGFSADQIKSTAFVILN